MRGHRGRRKGTRTDTQAEYGDGAAVIGGVAKGQRCLLRTPQCKHVREWSGRHRLMMCAFDRHIITARAQDGVGFGNNRSLSLLSSGSWFPGKYLEPQANFNTAPREESRGKLKEGSTRWMRGG